MVLALAAAFCAVALLWAPPPPDGYAVLLIGAAFALAAVRLASARAVVLLCAGEPIVVLTATANPVPALAAQGILLALVLADVGALPDVREAVLHAVFALSAAASALALTATWEPAASMLLLAAGVAACSLVLAVSGYRTRRACEPGRAVK